MKICEPMTKRCLPSIATFALILVLSSDSVSAQLVRIGGFGNVRIRAPFVAVDVSPFGSRIRAPFTSVNTGYYGVRRPVGYVYPVPTYPYPLPLRQPLYPSYGYVAPAVPISPVPVAPYPLSPDPTLPYPDASLAPREYYEPPQADDQIAALNLDPGMPSGVGNQVSPSESSLRSAAERLRQRLALRGEDGDIWIRYLGVNDIIAGGVDESGNLAKASELLRNYEGVTANPSLNWLSSIADFEEIRRALHAMRETKSLDNGEPTPRIPEDRIPEDTGESVLNNDQEQAVQPKATQPGTAPAPPKPEALPVPIPVPIAEPVSREKNTPRKNEPTPAKPIQPPGDAA